MAGLEQALFSAVISLSEAGPGVGAETQPRFQAWLGAESPRGCRALLARALRVFGGSHAGFGAEGFRLLCSALPPPPQGGFRGVTGLGGSPGHCSGGSLPQGPHKKPFFAPRNVP